MGEAVRRSALALDLLVDDETGAIAAAATMGLPERIGGARNYDYRYAWLRDANLTLEAMLRLGARDQVHVSLAWLLRTIRRTHPQLRPMYASAAIRGCPTRRSTSRLSRLASRHARQRRAGPAAARQLRRRVR